jgi:hypothetical protein
LPILIRTGALSLTSDAAHQSRCRLEFNPNARSGSCQRLPARTTRRTTIESRSPHRAKRLGKNLSSGGIFGLVVAGLVPATPILNALSSTESRPPGQARRRHTVAYEFLPSLEAQCGNKLAIGNALPGLQDRVVAVLPSGLRGPTGSHRRIAGFRVGFGNFCYGSGRFSGRLHIPVTSPYKVGGAASRRCGRKRLGASN